MRSRVRSAVCRLAALALLLLAALPALAASSVERLPNGLTVILEERPGASVTAVQVWIRTGSVDEPGELVGMTHFLEHMLFKGTTARPVGSIHAEIEKNGGEVNAATSRDWTYYHVTIASPEWRRALEILCDIAVNSTLDETEVEREREVIEEEIARKYDEPGSILYDGLLRASYGPHAYGRTVIGTETTLARVGRPELLAYYRAHYVPARMAVVISGDFVAATARRLIASTLGRLPPGRPARPLAAAIPQESVTLRLIGRAVSTYGAIGFRGPAARDVRMNAAGDVLCQILAGAGIGRLRREIVEELKLADDVDVAFPTSRGPALFALTYQCPPSNREAVEKALRASLRRLRLDGVTAGELQAAVNQLKRDRMMRMESSEERAFERGFWFAVSRPGDRDAYEAAIGALVPADLAAFVTRFLASTSEVTVSLDPAGVAAGREAAGEPEPVPFVHRMSDGPLAGIGIFLSAGRSVEPSPGWSALLAGAMNRGARGQTHEAFERRLSALGFSIGVSSQEDMISIVGTGEKEKAGLLLETLFEILERPNLDEIDVVRENLLSALRNKSDDPFEQALDRLNRLRYGDHPYGRPPEGTEPSLRAASALDLASWLERVAVRGNVRVAIVGGIDTAAFAARLGDLGRRLPAGPEATPPELHAFAPADTAETVPMNQAIVLRTYPAPSILDPDYPAWKVANAILGGRSSSRLFALVREEEGLAYAVGSFFPSRRLESQLVFYAGTRPSNAARVSEVYDRALTPPTLEELLDAKRLVRGEFALDHERVARRAWYLGWYSTLGRGADYDEDYPEQVNRVTLEDVGAVFERLRSMPRGDLRFGGAE